MFIKYAHSPSPPSTQSGMDPSPQTPQESKEDTYFSSDPHSISLAMTVKTWDNLSPGPSADCLPAHPGFLQLIWSHSPSSHLQLSLFCSYQLKFSFSHPSPISFHWQCVQLLSTVLSEIWALLVLDWGKRVTGYLLFWHLYFPLFPRICFVRLKPPECGMTQNPNVIIFFLGKLSKPILYLLIRKWKPRELLPSKT